SVSTVTRWDTVKRWDTRKQGNNEDTSSKAMLAIDGVGFDWSDMAEVRVQTNMALMAFSDSEVYNDKTWSKTCLKNYETLKKQYDDLIVKLNQTKFTTTTYKIGLATVEEQLITYRKNEVLFNEEVAVLKREVACKDYEINVLKSEFEKVKQEKEDIEFKIKKFDKASKDIDKLLGSQITDKSKKGLGYSAVLPPHPLIYNRPKKLDLSYSSLDEFKEPEFKGYGSEVKQVSKDTSSFVESSLNVDKETVFPVNKKVEFVKPKNHEKPVKKSVRYAEMYRSQTPRGNQRNWNGQKSNQLGSDFVMYNKACFICGSFNHVQAQCKYHQRERMVYGNNYNRVNYNYTTKRTHPNAQRNMVPRAVLMKTGLKPFNTARTVNTAHPKSIVFSAKPMPCFSKIAQSTGKPQQNDTGFVDSGCSRHMTGNIAYLLDFKEFDIGYVTFGGGAHGGRISDTKIPQSSGPPEKVGDEAVHKELGDRIERAATTASSLEAEQDTEFCDKHNMVAYLEKSEGSEGFHEIIDFLSASHIHYALTASPTIYTSLIEQFWQTAALCTIDDGVLGITATIDRKVKITVSEGSIRRHLKLEDSEGIPSPPTIEIFEQLALMGVITPLFNTMLVQPQGVAPSIQTIPDTSPSKITSSPSLSSHHTSISAPSTSQPPITPTKEPALMPYESPLYSVYSLGRDEGKKDLQQTKKTYSIALTRLILRVKKLEKTVKTSKARRRARVVIFKDEDAVEDSSKQGTKVSDIDTDPTISLVQPQQDVEYDFDVSTAEGFTTASILVTTSSASISTVSPPRVSTTEDISGAETLVYIRKSASKAKDKGKSIMQKSEQPKKIKKRLDERKEVLAKEAHDIDWSDPSVLRYHALQNGPFSVAKVRKNMCMYLKNQGSEKKSGGRRKKSLARKREKETLSEESVKKQKLEDDVEKEEL
ncbi:hypothetical protein Tco_0481941, partial [Tanacetum coccineum]